jgi:amino acid transporter
MLFPLLSFLQLDSSSSEALSILLALITGGGIVDYITMSITFLFYYRACKVQGVDRKKMPYYGYFQPYGAWIALVLQIVVVYTYGYTSLAPFNAKNFFSNYTMQIIAPFLYLGWKLLKGTKLVKAEECDLVWDRPVLDAYEERMMILEPPTSFWTETRDMFRFKQKKSVPDVHV